MLKKFGLVAIGVTAGLAVAAPLASAAETPVSGEGNVGQLLENNVFGQHVGEGNTFNGVPVGPSDSGSSFQNDPVSDVN